MSSIFHCVNYFLFEESTRKKMRPYSGRLTVVNDKEPQANSGAHFFGFPCVNCSEPIVFLRARCGFVVSDFNATKITIHMHCKSCGHIDTYDTVQIRQFSAENDAAH
jgi:hypothetical protein